MTKLAGSVNSHNSAYLPFSPFFGISVYPYGNKEREPKL